ncbi:BLUE COPPER PROTEIN [Salix koriyanagi]|uniref:BLUE COPPER PROTEIN n=1 Tax=Salix koriyanagi TaxID=2511006 RepID=A0A9Q0W4R0_9ROSI|nr:BLUE COPPER PROTEIN [Salix koriyanagi]
MAGRLSFTVGFLIVASMGLLHGACAASTYMVGDDLGWTVPPNSSYYEEWASQRTFQIGDTFVFNWTTGTHSATEVSTREEYDNCTKMGMILMFAGVQIINLKTPPTMQVASSYPVALELGDPS